MLDSTWQDIKLAVRALRRRPTFTLLALLTLTLGIGATTAVFAVARGVLWSALPYPEPDRLVTLWEVGESGRTIHVAYPNFVDWRDQATSFAGLAAYSGDFGGATSVTGAGIAPVRIGVAGVGARFFTTLGVAAEHGRVFTTDENTEGAPAVAVVSKGFWQRQLGGARDLDGKTLRLYGETYTVVGVVGDDVRLPAGAEIWVPLERWGDGGSRTAHNFRVVGRLAEGITRTEAGAEMSLIAERLQQAHAGDNDAVDVRVTELRAELVGAVRRPLALILGAAALALLAACSNLASGLLARAMSRRREMAVRAALGAGRGRVIRQLLTESLVLAVAGGILGVLLARGLLDALLAARPDGLPRPEAIVLDPVVLGFAFAAVLATGVAFGMLPALAASRLDLRGSLAAGERAGGTGQARAWSLLVAAEVALAVMLLAGSTLLLKSLWGVLSVAPGFESRGVVTVELAAPVFDLPADPSREQNLAYEAHLAATYGRVLDELRAVPGVEAAGLVSHPPLGGVDINGTIVLGDRPEDEPGYGGYRVASEGYFAAMGIPLLAGRAFDARDMAGAAHAAIVNRSFAEAHWPGREALGQRVRPRGLDLHRDEWMTVVGVVGDVRHDDLVSAPQPELYVALGQRARRASLPTVVVRASGDPADLVTALRVRLGTAVPEMPATFATMQGRLWRSLAERRFSAAMLGAFAFLALVLAATGIYGVVSYSVARRTREFGVRMALGASPLRVVAGVLRASLLVVAAGMVAGLAATWGAGRWLSSELHGVSVGDPGAWLAALVVLATAALVAVIVPARRGVHVDPVEALRAD